MLFSVGNYIEAAFWIVLGLVFGVVALRSAARRRAVALAALTFTVFGVSDLVEVQTGAWWRPWWLLVWKSACVVVLVALLVRHVRAARRPAPR